MQLAIQIAITDDSGNTRTQELMVFDKAGDALSSIGLSVSESKQLLKSVQQSVVQLQADEYIHRNIKCPHCHASRRIKGRHGIQYRTLFGVIPINGIRVYRCQCEKCATKTVSLLSNWAGDHTHPELKYIEARWASMISYEQTVRLLQDILPVNDHLNASTVRNHLCQVARRLDAEAEAHSGNLSGCPREWGQLPRPGKPIVVGIDGGYVRNRDDRKHNFEIIAGKSFSVDAPSETKRFGFVQTTGCHPGRRLMAHLTSRECRRTAKFSFYPMAQIISGSFSSACILNPLMYLTGFMSR